MAYTKFGELMRIYRVQHHEVMGDIAKVLGVKSSFLSAVENGKKNVPKEWVNLIISHYDLTKPEIEELRNAIEESKVQYKIQSTNAGTIQRRAAMQFTRAFDELDDETALKIIELLSRNSGGK